MINKKKKYTRDELFEIISKATLKVDNTMLEELEEEARKEKCELPVEMKMNVILQNMAYTTYLVKFLFEDEEDK